MSARKRASHLLLSITLATTLLTGCSATNNVLNFKKDDFKWASAQNPAVQIVAIWEPAEGQGLDGMPTRGFAGQLIFIGRNSAPLAVKGDMKIYVFDNVGTREDQTKPIHRFDFSAEAWNLHLVKGSLGPSYNLFIPYTRQNEHRQVQCSLRARLTTESGQTVMSDMVAVTLPGPKMDEAGMTVEDSSRATQEADADIKEATEATVDGSSSGDIDEEVFAEIERRFKALQQKRKAVPEASGEVTHKSHSLGTIGANGQVNSIQQVSATAANQAESKAGRIAVLEAQLRELQAQQQTRVQNARAEAHAELLDSFEDEPEHQPAAHPLEAAPERTSGTNPSHSRRLRIQPVNPASRQSAHPLETGGANRPLSENAHPLSIDGQFQSADAVEDTHTETHTPQRHPLDDFSNSEGTAAAGWGRDPFVDQHPLR